MTTHRGRQIGGSLRVSVVSFNANEREAIELLLNNDLAQAGWRYGAGEWRDPSGTVIVAHAALLAQGNVIAGAELARSTVVKKSDYVIFYGCAGGVSDAAIGDVFAVSGVTYMSLGSVRDAGGGLETVRLKNRYVAPIQGAEDRRLRSIAMPTTGLFNFVINAAKMRSCFALSTDKVVKVSPGHVPSHVGATPAGKTFDDEEWTYAATAAYLAECSAGTPVVLDMESYGGLAIADAILSLSKVLVIRVVTDSLGDHDGSDARQARLLARGRLAVLEVITLLTEVLSAPE